MRGERRVDLRDLARLSAIAERLDAARASRDADGLAVAREALQSAAVAECEDGRLGPALAGAGDGKETSVRAKIQQRRLEIAAELRDLRAPADDAHLVHARALLGELISLAKVDAAGGD